MRQPTTRSARGLINRTGATWAGIVDPVDNFSLANPPSNEKLLDALARDFIEHKFDIRHIERTICCRGRTSCLDHELTNKPDRGTTRAYVRPMAEVVVDALNAPRRDAELRQRRLWLPGDRGRGEPGDEPDGQLRVRIRAAAADDGVRLRAAADPARRRNRS
jgi:hypothetical protein